MNRMCKDEMFSENGRKTARLWKSGGVCFLKLLTVTLALFFPVVPCASADVNTTLVDEYALVHMRSPESWHYLKNVRYNPITNALIGGFTFCEGSLNITLSERDDAPPLLVVTFTSYTTRREISYLIADALEFVDVLKRSISSKPTLKPGILHHKGVDLSDGSRSNYVLEYVTTKEGGFNLQLDRANIGITVALSGNALQALTSRIQPASFQEPDAMPADTGEERELKGAFLTGTNVNLRTGPGVKSPVIATLKGNEWVRVYSVSEDGKWTNVEVYMQNGRNVGWIASEYIGYPLESETRITMEFFEKALTALGKNREEVVRRLGKPERIEHHEGTEYSDDFPFDTYFYPGVTLSIASYDPEEKVESLSTTEYEIVQGLPVGSSVDALKEKMGIPTILRIKKAAEEWVYGTSGEGMYWEQLIFILQKGKIVQVKAGYY